MKKTHFILMGLLLLALSGIAIGQPALNSLGFIAPWVSSTTDVDYPEKGEIIYNLSNNILYYYNDTSWTSLGPNAESILSCSTAATVSSQTIVLANRGAGCTEVNLPSSPYTGQKVFIKKTDATSNGTVPIKNSTTIATLYSLEESLLFVYDGTNWQTLDHHVGNEVVEDDHILQNFSSYDGGLGSQTWGELGGVTLTPGTWDVSIHVGSYANGSITSSVLCTGISNDNTNVAPGSEAQDYICTTLSATDATRSSLTLTKRNITISSTDTYYVKVYYGASPTNLQLGFTISARRVH